MKILIVSDTHKSHGNLEKAIQDAGRIDMLIHLGDVEGPDIILRALHISQVDQHVDPPGVLDRFLQVPM